MYTVILLGNAVCIENLASMCWHYFSEYHGDIFIFTIKKFLQSCDGLHALIQTDTGRLHALIQTDGLCIDAGRLHALIQTGLGLRYWKGYMPSYKQMVCA